MPSPSATRPPTPPPETDARVRPPTFSGRSDLGAEGYCFRAGHSYRKIDNKPILYVYSGGTDTTIYADQNQASLAVGVVWLTGLSAKSMLLPASAACLSTPGIPRDVQSEEAAKNVFPLQVFGHTLVAPSSFTTRTSATARAAIYLLMVVAQTFERFPSNRTQRVAVDTNIDDDTENWVDTEEYTAPDLPMHTAAKQPRKRKWYAATDDTLRYWVHNYCDAYLQVLITREGPMAQEGQCPCGEPSKYRCGDCFGGQLLSGNA
ncbi:hypothetical protein K438DRAFT_1769236 [Mycena galopus ATCC 62051]|nr:hypothetical protein K438DRAFT_1769236 [Mycena galopus ATCC 62051]